MRSSYEFGDSVRVTRRRLWIRHQRCCITVTCNQARAGSRRPCKLLCSVPSLCTYKCMARMVVHAHSRSDGFRRRNYNLGGLLRIGRSSRCQYRHQRLFQWLPCAWPSRTTPPSALLAHAQTFLSRLLCITELSKIPFRRPCWRSIVHTRVAVLPVNVGDTKAL